MNNYIYNANGFLEHYENRGNRSHGYGDHRYEGHGYGDHGYSRNYTVLGGSGNNYRLYPSLWDYYDDPAIILIPNAETLSKNNFMKIY